MRTHYDNLKVMRNAPPEVIRAAYKVLCQKYHPDKYAGSSESAERVMKILNSAYAVLSDIEKKMAYDKSLEELEARANAEASSGAAQQGHQASEEPERESWAYESDTNTHHKPKDSAWQSRYGAYQDPPQIEYHLPVRRFFARTIDYLCGNLIVIAVIAVFAGLGWWHYEPRHIMMYPLILSMLPSFVWMLLEAGIIKSFGNTPGKQLLGLRLVRNGQTSNYMKRSFAVWVRGMGLGLPLVSWITATLAYSRLTKTTQTSWDKDYGFVIEAEPMDFTYGFSATAAMLLSLTLIVAGHLAVNQWNGWAMGGVSPGYGSIKLQIKPIPMAIQLETPLVQPTKSVASTVECNPVPADIDRLKQCAERGDALAQGTLGRLYEEGIDVPKNRSEAFSWVLKAALQGVASEQYHLALMYFAGQGIAQNDSLALYWLHEAIKQGHGKAQYTLGCLYDEGKTVPQDDAEATKWYRLAAEQGDEAAKARLNERSRLRQ